VLGCAAALSACTLTLDDGIACGDGFVDEDFEECDPGDPRSFVNACLSTNRPDGVGACDPVTCEIINDLEQCAVCGDDRVDESIGEQCDGSNLNGRTCLGGVGTLQCSTSCRYDESECKNCGNGSVDPGEECDPNTDGIDLTMGKPPCVELTSPFQPYTAGTPGPCRDDCLWERTGCSYCGNNNVEGPVPVDFEGATTIPEWCDGSDFDPEILDQELGNSVCTQANSDTRPIVECADNCLDLIPVDAEQPCCLKGGVACPTLSSVKCCFEIDHPNSTLLPCQVVVLEDGNFTEVCR